MWTAPSRYIETAYMSDSEIPVVFEDEVGSGMIDETKILRCPDHFEDILVSGCKENYLNGIYKWKKGYKITGRWELVDESFLFPVTHSQGQKPQIELNFGDKKMT